jgi:hypothetical protein
LYRIDLPADPSVAVFYKAEIEAHRAWSLTSRRTFEEIRGSVRPPFPLGRVLIVETNGRLHRIEFPQLGPLQVTKERGTIRIESTVRDIERCGLLAWGRDKFTGYGRTLDIEVLYEPLESLEECLWAEPYPNGARAVVCLTDHADFDSCEKIRLLLPLLERAGFRFTKSVFPHSDPHPTSAKKNEPGIENPTYRRLIEELADQGTEIAFHGLSPRIDAPAFKECVRRFDLLAEFDPVTWIDHGTGAYLFTRQNQLDGGVALSSFLEFGGIRNYWSYFDLWGNPARRLSMWTEWTAGDWLSEEAANVGRVRSPLRAVLHGLRYSASNLLGEFGRLEPGGGWRAVAANVKLDWGVRRDPAVLYTRAGLTALSDPDSAWVFDTVLLNYLGHQLQPANLERLCEESGMMLAHCYLGWRRFAGNVFAPNGELRVEPRFVEAVEHAALLQRNARLALLSFRDLRRSLTAFANTRIHRTARGWRIQSRGEVPITIAGVRAAEGGSFLMLPATRTEETVAYCDVPANCELFIPSARGAARIEVLL